MKTCTRCNVWLPLENFSKKKSSKDGLVSHCKKCERERYLEWYKNKGGQKKVRNYLDEYRKNNKEKCDEWNRISRERNKVKALAIGKKWREANKDRMAELKREWRKRNPHKDHEYNHQRRVRKLGRISNMDAKSVLDASNGICYWCGKKAEKIELDHYVPISKGGSNSVDNLVVSCKKCNRSKHDKNPVEFANSIGKLL